MTHVDPVERPCRAAAATDIATAAQLACLLEVTAPKPGNVSPVASFDDASYLDFLASAAAIGGPLSSAGARPLGTTIRLAVEATRRWTTSNTNLGIILLLTPLARAAHDPAVSGSNRTSGGGAASDFSRALREALRLLLDATTIDDAREVYAAIRAAAPGGLGRVAAQDVRHEPDVTLVEAMRLAASRDGVALEYATAFEVTFTSGVPVLERARRDGLSWSDAIVDTYLTLLASAPDTHVARRGGAALAEEVSRRARAVLEAGGVRSAAGRQAMGEMDRALRDPRHAANPGTTADLTAAAIFVVLLAGGWRSE
jgi:triphosphoribosyl-dephospho-CoA synthase